MGQHFGGFGADALLELGRGEDMGLAAIAEDPAGDFFEAGEGGAEFDGMSRGVEGDDLLGGVPLALGDDAGGPAVEADADLVALGGVVWVVPHSEAAAEVGRGVEVDRADELGFEEAKLADALQGEGADGLALGVKGEEIPALLDLAEVIGVDLAALWLGGSQLVVEEARGAPVHDRVEKFAEEADARGQDADGFDREGRFQFLPLEGNFAGAGLGDFAEALPEHLLQAGAAQGSEGMAGEEEGHQVVAGEVQQGKIVNCEGIVKAVLDGVVGQGEAELVAHEAEVALNGFGGDFDGFG